MSINTLLKSREEKTAPRISSNSGRLGAVAAAISAAAAMSCTSDARSAHNGKGDERPAGSDTVYVQVQPDTYEAPSPDTLVAGPDTLQEEPEVTYVSPDTVSPDTISPEDDDDKDGIPNSKDKCKEAFDYQDQSGGSIDIDGDGKGDACDKCPADADDNGVDSDDDGKGDVCDNAPDDYNPSQADDDKDGIGNIADKAPNCFNPEQIDNDGDGYDPSCGDCNDNSADINPGALDAPCDSEDTDCGGEAEECACTVGATQSIPGSCADGEKTCQLTGAESSGWVTTTEPDNGTQEICGDGIDQDCSTVADDMPGCVNQCVPAATQDCGETAGECGKKLGTSTCDENGAWEPCVGNTTPIPETCNGKDDDCDDAIDEDFEVGEPCTPPGICGEVEGHKECFGTNATVCSTAPGGSEDKSSDEICNKKDDSCNGKVDEELCPVAGGKPGETAKVGDLCKTGKGDCEEISAYVVYELPDGTVTNGVTCKKNAMPGVEVCDNANPPHNEDCDEMANENCGGYVVGDKTACTPTGEPYVCAEGTSTFLGVDANGNPLWGACEGAKLGEAEIPCNGEDDDCDEAVDETPQGKPGDDCSKSMQGVCKEGNPVWMCDQNGNMVCSGELNAESTDVSCGDGKDNNCKNGVDEEKIPVVGAPDKVGKPGEPCTVGLGDCQENKTFVCAEGESAVECVGTKTPGKEICDLEKHDEDCDGKSNEICGVYVNGDKIACKTEPVVCAEGTSTFKDGEWGDCVGQVFTTTEICDGEDNDCDKIIDEGYIPEGGFLGMDKLCIAPGECAFINGELVQGHLECNPTDPTAEPICSTGPLGSSNLSQPEKCNGKDDDCNKKIDDGKGMWSNGDPGIPCEIGTPNNTDCVGVTACTPDGKDTFCKTAVKPDQKTELCDGKDNNCKNGVDEGYNLGATCTGTTTGLTGVVTCSADGKTSECSAK